MFPTVITFEILKELCKIYQNEIGEGMFHLLPPITIRYIDCSREFRYAKFGEFFFWGNDLYVWKNEKEYQCEHNQDVVIEIFNDECTDRGYACRRIFSGIKTKYKDSNNEYIYTGDVLKVFNTSDDVIYNLAVGTITFDRAGQHGFYGFLLDNHSWNLSDCMEKYMVTRIGSVFFQIDENAESENVNFQTLLFNNNGYDDIDEKTKLLMASYTPNTDQEIWKYSALKMLGVEPWFR